MLERLMNEKNVFNKDYAILPPTNNVGLNFPFLHVYNQCIDIG
jgi:hypothetical protein